MIDTLGHPFNVYDADRALWEALDLPYHGMAAHADWVEVGTVEHEANEGEVWAEIRIEAMLMPARFWRFTITPRREDVHAVTLDRPTVLLFAGGMMTAEVPS